MDFMCTKFILILSNLSKDKFCVCFFIGFVWLDFCIIVSEFLCLSLSISVQRKIAKCSEGSHSWCLCHECISMYTNECHSKLSNYAHTFIRFFSLLSCKRINSNTFSWISVTYCWIIEIQINSIFISEISSGILIEIFLTVQYHKLRWNFIKPNELYYLVM